MSASQQTIVVVKKKRPQGAHHGGAWKVAYADFVTAMMALFIVLWLMSASQDVQRNISGYFRDPKGFGKQLGSSMSGNGESLTISKDQMDLLKGKIEQALRKSPEFSKLKDYVEMTVTGEGLRIELLESERGTFFERGEAAPTEAGKDLLVRLAKEVGKLTNTILVEGHTDSKPFQRATYSNWELSADRANAARRIMDDNGLRPNQVKQIRGFADQQLRTPDQPDDSRNRRISIIIQYLQAQTSVESTQTLLQTAARNGAKH
jgi:chemotaxis protein MotB